MIGLWKVKRNTGATEHLCSRCVLFSRSSRTALVLALLVKTRRYFFLLCQSSSDRWQEGKRSTIKCIVLMYDQILQTNTLSSTRQSVARSNNLRLPQKEHSCFPARILLFNILLVSLYTNSKITVSLSIRLALYQSESKLSIKLYIWKCLISSQTKILTNIKVYSTW